MKYHKNTILNFGKYKGAKVKEVIKEDPHYLKWCWENIDWFKASDKVKHQVEIRMLENPVSKYSQDFASRCDQCSESDGSFINHDYDNDSGFDSYSWLPD